jgi:hypothetical protein
MLLRDFLQALVAVLALVAVAAVLKNMFAVPKMPVYLVDFSVHKGLDEWRFSKDMFIPLSRQTGVSCLTDLLFACCFPML